MTYQDRDIPVEYTGRADLVTAGCSVCREVETVPNRRPLLGSPARPAAWQSTNLR